MLPTAFVTGLPVAAPQRNLATQVCPPVATSAPPRPRRGRPPARAPRPGPGGGPKPRSARGGTKPKPESGDHATGRRDKGRTEARAGREARTAAPSATTTAATTTVAQGDGKGTPSSSETRCGFVALLGPSNSGKSTLLNRLVGQKVAIVTPRVQTTRCRVAGIATHDETQLIFLDTPGIFEPGSRLARAMVKAAWRSGRDADVVALVVDAAAVSRIRRRRRARGARRSGLEGGDGAERGAGLRDAGGEMDMETQQKDEEEDENEDDEPSGFVIAPELDGILAGLARSRGRGRLDHLVVIANKSDMVRGPARRLRVEQAVAHIVERAGMDATSSTVFHVSARDGDGVDELATWACGRVPPGPWLYDADAVTDMPMRQLACESVRETCLLVLRHELAYELAVECTGFDETRADGSMRVDVDILVKRDSQKRIVTGRGGEMVKRIGSTARAQLADMLGATVHLFVTVKVRPKWTEEKWQYESWGLDFDA